jgi:hypothetical protein
MIITETYLYDQTTSWALDFSQTKHIAFDSNYKQQWGFKQLISCDGRTQWRTSVSTALNTTLGQQYLNNLPLLLFYSQDEILADPNRKYFLRSQRWIHHYKYQPTRCLSWPADFFKMGRSSASIPLVNVLNTTPSSSLTVNWRNATLLVLVLEACSSPVKTNYTVRGIFELPKQTSCKRFLSRPEVEDVVRTVVRGLSLASILQLFVTRLNLRYGCHALR